MPTAARAGVYESGSVRVHPTGKVEVFTGSHSHGQGHETTFAQVVADRLGVPLEDAKIHHGDTEEIPYGMGTYGSRSISVGGSAIVKAVDKITSIAQEAASYGRGGMRAKRKRSICICIYIMQGNSFPGLAGQDTLRKRSGRTANIPAPSFRVREKAHDIGLAVGRGMRSLLLRICRQTGWRTCVNRPNSLKVYRE